TSYTDTPLPITWDIENYGRRTAPEIVRCRVLVFKGQDTDPSKVYEVPRGRFDFILPESLPAGDYRVVVEATDLWGQPARRDPLEFHIYATIWEFIRKYLAWVGGAIFAVHLLAFLGLVAASRWSVRAFVILTHPWVLYLGIYYGLALQNVRPL